MEKLQPHSKSIRIFYLCVGVIATIAYRIIIIFSADQNFLIRLFWYIGTIGFVIYFIHRYQISEKRSKIISDHNLDEKVAQITSLGQEDKESLSFVIKSLKVSSERWNFIVIFVTSVIALLIGIYLDLIK